MEIGGSASRDMLSANLLVWMLVEHLISGEYGGASGDIAVGEPSGVDVGKTPLVSGEYGGASGDIAVGKHSGVEVGGELQSVEMLEEWLLGYLVPKEC